MSVTWNTAVVFCRDARALSRWWAEVLGWPVTADVNDDGRVLVLPESGPGLEFVEVGEDLTLAPATEGGHLAELARLEAMGATVIVEPEDDSADFWILEDPEGNGFSLWRSGARSRGLFVALDPAASA
jgi:Glyoxalase-like domain